jgi:hypothetical protein
MPDLYDEVVLFTKATKMFRNRPVNSHCQIGDDVPSIWRQADMRLQ